MLRSYEGTEDVLPRGADDDHDDEEALGVDDGAVLGLTFGLSEGAEFRLPLGSDDGTNNGEVLADND